jgi:2C-methyl-D-erythritol 2,4-cyclodiphosphate synthase
MRGAIAARLGAPTDAVNVKASSGNLLGDEGAGRSISAMAVALLEAGS